MCVTGYFRPGELLRLRRCDLIPPATQVMPAWCVPIAPEDLDVPTKTGSFNDSVTMDSAYTTFLNPFFKVMAKSDDKARIWKFEYPEFVGCFRKATDKFNMKGVVPY